MILNRSGIKVVKLLIIEDEIKTGSYLKKGFTESGYVVDLSLDGVDGLYQATTNHYDLIILDIIAAYA